MASGFLYVNGRPLNRNETRTPQQIFRSLPKGAYTSFRVERCKTVLNWRLHLQRLQRSVTLLTEQAPDTYPVFKSQKFDQQDLKTAVGNSIRSAVEDVLHRSPSVHDQTVAVLLSRPEDDSDRPYDVYTYVRHTQEIDIHARPIQVWVKGRGREIPEAKYSKWMRDRIPLERAKPDRCQEVILVNEGGGLLEGLTSTFYVIKRNDDGAYVLQTAGLEDGILVGIFRKTVLDVAVRPEFDLKLEESCPMLSASDTWIEAFVSNSFTGIRPISKMIVAEGNEEIVFDAPGKCTARLMETTEAAHERTDITELGV